MNNTQKILIAVGVGVGVAYVYNVYKKGKKPSKGKPSKGKSEIANVNLQIPENAAISDLTREEKEEFILDNTSATPQEISSGFEGTRFVWNPSVEKMYPVGTIQEGEQPTFGEIFNSAEGYVVSGIPKSDIPNSVSNAEKSLKDLTDKEIELLFLITKRMKESQSVLSEEDALKELGITNPNIIKVVRQKLKKRLNDIKIMKKDANWKSNWSKRKEKRRKRRIDFKEKMGFDKNMFDKQVRMTCGNKKTFGRSKAQYVKCVEMIADKMRSQIKSEIRVGVATAPLSVKDEINKSRQESFAKQITNRDSGGIFAGQRWDGESNAYIENLVDKALV
jgi:hypothetical protein